mmetsp:Transcript_9610/g.18110  ORF Transcript_9610/g.18110 Transcript_9610/m.18110 type:complete len:300 (+) Transcript_9610:393-1292(+)
MQSRKQHQFARTRKDGNFNQQVQLWRFVFGGLALLCAVYAESIDSAVERSWSWIKEKQWFQHDTFEPLVATLSFAVWIHAFRILDLMPLGQYIIDPKYRALDARVGFGVKVKSGLVYLGTLFTFDFLYPRRKLPDTCPGGAGKVLLHIVLALFVYDFLFFHIHVAMHKVEGLRSFHKKHHSVRGLHSTEVLRHSFVDGSLQVMCNIAALNLLKLHPYSRTLYNIVVTYMLTEIHCGYDLPWMLHNVIPFGLLGGSVRHEEHHITGRRYFQQFFTYLDATYFDAENTCSSRLVHTRTARD